MHERFFACNGNAIFLKLSSHQHTEKIMCSHPHTSAVMATAKKSQKKIARNSVTFHDKMTDFFTHVATTTHRRRNNFQITVANKNHLCSRGFRLLCTKMFLQFMREIPLHSLHLSFHNLSLCLEIIILRENN